MTTPKQPWRQEIELLQNYSKHKTFTHTTTTANAETVVDVAGNMEEAKNDKFRIALLNTDECNNEGIQTRIISSPSIFSFKISLCLYFPVTGPC